MAHAFFMTVHSMHTFLCALIIANSRTYKWKQKFAKNSSAQILKVPQCSLSVLKRLKCFRIAGIEATDQHQFISAGATPRTLILWNTQQGPQSTQSSQAWPNSHLNIQAQKGMPTLSLYDTPLDLSWISNSHPSDASDELCQRPGFHMTCWSQPMATSMQHMWWMTTSDWHPAMTWILRCLDAGQVGKVGNFGVWWTHLYQWTSHGGCEFSLLFRSCWTSKTAESRGHMRAHHVHTRGVARCLTRSRRWGMAGVSPSQNADADMFGGFKCLCCCDPDGGGCGKIAALYWFGGNQRTMRPPNTMIHLIFLPCGIIFSRPLPIETFHPYAP